MSKRAIPRAVSPLLAKLRDLLLGRDSIDANRFPDYIAKRTQPFPNLPGGSSDKLADNYYYKRDGRREVSPNLLLVKNTGLKQLASSSTPSAARPSTERVPGNVFNY